MRVLRPGGSHPVAGHHRSRSGPPEPAPRHRRGRADDGRQRTNLSAEVEAEARRISTARSTDGDPAQRPAVEAPSHGCRSRRTPDSQGWPRLRRPRRRVPDGRPARTDGPAFTPA
jgi:hypothetical protein